VRRLLLLVLGAVACAAPADGGQGERTTMPADPSPGALSPFLRAKAGALLAGRLPCQGCHQLDGSGGTIGPDLTTVAARRSRAEIEQMIRDPQRMAPGSAMPRVAMPDDWVVLLADFLGGARPVSGTPPLTAIPPAVPVPLGVPPDQVYARFCAACHGTRGEGNGPNAAALPVRPTPHADASAMALRPDDVLYDAIAGGGWIMGKSARMPPFGATLAPDDIRGLVRHIRTLCACQGPAWSRDGAAVEPAR
jgi:mono/diheme cytochrome c family protein